jgi:hypothetical protein
VGELLARGDRYLLADLLTYRRDSKPPDVSACEPNYLKVCSDAHGVALRCGRTGQGTPGGRYPNRTSVFNATATGLSSPCPDPVGEVYDEHLKRNITVWLFNIAKVRRYIDTHIRLALR